MKSLAITTTVMMMAAVPHKGRVTIHHDHDIMSQTRKAANAAKMAGAAKTIMARMLKTVEIVLFPMLLRIYIVNY